LEQKAESGVESTLALAESGFIDLTRPLLCLEVDSENTNSALAT